jgi:hypothetical protein
MAGAARFVDADDRVTEVWHPRMPLARARYWLAATRWTVPQPATFWRRACFDRYGPFRQDMHYVFDTEFCVRLGFAGQFPALVGDQLAVRVVHDQAKSWDTRPFDAEAEAMEREYRARLTRPERAVYAVKRALIAANVHKLVDRVGRPVKERLTR